MNKRLALLMQESQSWDSQFTQFQGFTEKLSSEAMDLRTKLEKERREAKRLSGVVSESKTAQEELKTKLQKAEEAHKEALEELERIEEFRKELQEQRDIMFSEMSNLVAAAEDVEILDEIEAKIEMKAETWSARSMPGPFTNGNNNNGTARVNGRSSMTLLRAPSKASLRGGRASSLGPINGRETGHHRSRKISTASNATTRTLTELKENEEVEGEQEKDNADEHDGMEDTSHEMEDEEYLEAAAMRRIVSILLHGVRGPSIIPVLS